MKFSVKVTSIFECSIEKAFKTPVLCDITKVHTGFLFFPRVSHTTEDNNWGRINSSKKVHVSQSIFQRGGVIFTDNIVERVENKYWRLELNEFQIWMCGFYKFEGVWKTTHLDSNKVLVEYSYCLYTNRLMLYPLYWVFAKVFWRIYMKRVVENIREMVRNEEPYLYQ